MNRIETHFCDLIKREEPFVLATILSQSGSTPRLPGTGMIICRDGSIVGTIGGGLVEAQVMEAAPGLFQSGGAVKKHFNLDRAAAGSMDMICGGEMLVLLELVSPEPGLLEMFEAFSGCVAQGKKSVLVADITGVDGEGGGVRRCLFTEAGEWYGSRDFSRQVLETLLERVGKQRSPSVLMVAGRQLLAEPSFSSGTVYLFGAGHVSRQVARLTRMVDFRTVVLDDRAEFANRQRFDMSDKVIVLESFDKAFEGLVIGEDSYLVILTRGHSHDQTVLEQALKTPARYVGMIGSSKKRETIYRSMMEKGYAKEALAQVHSPIGLAIGGETPEEIAVSIVGELIAKRAGKG